MINNYSRRRYAMKIFNKCIIASFIFIVISYNSSNAQESIASSRTNGGEDVLMENYSKPIPINGAEVYLKIDDRIVFKTKTDMDGNFKFKNLKPAHYVLECKLPGKADEWTKRAKSVSPQKLHVNFKIESELKSPITFGSKTGKNPLCFELPKELDIENNILSGSSFTSENNYGINDGGIK